jgi:hypothetical protein
VLSVRDNLIRTTPIQIYIFYEHTPTNTVHNLSTECMVCNIHLVKIHASDWIVQGTRESDESVWTTGFTKDYRIMGKWRLTFPFLFSRLMGHRYMLFLDTDSTITGPVDGNLVELHDKTGFDVGFRNKVLDPSIGQGLAELARYFIVSRGTKPTQLFDDCAPPNISGVHTWDGTTGWRTTVMYGNFVLWSLDFWFTKSVQDFLNLALLTEDVVVHRWNEQQVMAMIRLLFVEPSREILYSFSYSHER